MIHLLLLNHEGGGLRKPCNGQRASKHQCKIATKRCNAQKVQKSLKTLPNAVLHKVPKFNGFGTYGWKVEATSPGSMIFCTFGALQNVVKLFHENFRNFCALQHVVRFLNENFELFVHYSTW